MPLIVELNISYWSFIVLFSVRSIRISPSLTFRPWPNKHLLPIALIKVYFTFSSAIRERLYTQIQEEDFEHKTIKDVLSYEHPTKYIVVDTEYTDDKKLTPVLTANKAFILGYTPEQENIYGKGDCIIFDGSVSKSVSVQAPSDSSDMQI